jgi:CheY-like chemotaxis protein
MLNMSSKGFCFDTVIIIDDSEVDRYIAKYFMQANNFSKETIEFDTAHTAIEYLKNYRNNFHGHKVLILLDIQMPVMNGFEFLEEMKDFFQSEKENFSIMILSSSFDIYDQRKAEENALVQMYIVKPLNETRLEEVKISCMSFREEKERSF